MTKKVTKKAKLDPKLEPEEGTQVPTGEEETPESRPGQHDNDLKAMYSKARKNRDIVTRSEQDENPDAEMIAKMVAETADEEEFEHTGSEVDLDRPERHEDDDEGDDDAEYVASPKSHEDEEEIEEEPPKEPEKDTEPEEKPKDLEYELEDGKVKVKVEGIEYLVPQSDVESAGGIAQYQRNRASNQRFEKAATYGKALQKERQELEQLQLDSSAKGEPPQKGVLGKKAELEDFRVRILDAALDGTESDLDKILEELRSTGEKQDSPGEPEPLVSEQVIEEFETAYALDRAEANRLLMDQYADVMDDEDLREIAHRKYLELGSNPESFGRTAVEMAREAGNFVRNITRAGRKDGKVQEKELEARREKKRVLPRSSQARSKSRPPETKKPRSSREYIRDIQRKQGSRR